MKRKITSLLLALSLCLGLVVPAALAAGDFQTTNDVLTKYTGSGGDVVIPSGVLAIGDGVFKDRKDLTSVTIPAGVTSIGRDAFLGCSSLTDLTLPKGVSIGDNAFYDCDSLTSLTIPEGVSLGENAFAFCSSLTSVTISEGVTSIGYCAFSGCKSLTSVTIPDSVTSIGTYAFAYCSSLTSVTIPEGVTSIGYRAFYECSSLTGVTIPEGVTSIGGGAFEGCKSLTSVTIPASVSQIWGNAFGRNITICGADGSYAQLWAMEEGYTFEATLPPAATPGRTAYSSIQNILVNGVPVEFQAYALKDKNGNPTNYVKLRDVASVLNGTSAQFNVGWDGKVSVTTGTPYTPNGSEMTTPYSGDRTYSSIGTNFVRLDGKDKSMLSLLLKDTEGNGYTYFKLRDLGAALGFNVDWTAEKGIFIETK